MTDSSDLWARVDKHLEDLIVRPDPVLGQALAHNHDEGLPEIDVSPAHGALLRVLVRGVGAHRVLEIGTLGGYSSIWIAGGLVEGGHLTTLELEEHHARVARENIARAGFADKVTVVVNPAEKSLEALIANGAEPFDFVFIDADKPGYPRYLELVMHLVRPGTLIFADNVGRQGQIVDPNSEDDRVQGIQRFLKKVAAEPGLESSVIQTVGAKGYDGFALSVVK